MSLLGKLAGFALRHAVHESADKVVSLVEQHFTDPSQRLPKALVRANERAWQVLGLALAGDALFDRVKDMVLGRDMTALRDQLRGFLAATPTGLEMSPAELRTRACEELTRLRKSGRLATPLERGEIESDIRRYGDPSKLVSSAEEAVAAVADALTADSPHLAQVLRIAPPGGTPLLAGAFLYFFRREAESNQELGRALTFDSLRVLTAGQDRGFALLDDRTAGILDQFDVLFDEFAAVNRKLDAGFAGVDAKLDDIQRRLLKPGVSYATDDERAFLSRAKEEFRRNGGRVSAAEWARLGDAMNTARMYAEASDAHEAAATTAQAVRDTATEAANHYKAYLDACEAGAWLRAFGLLWKAVELEPAHYRPFINRRYRPERILGGGAFGTVFLCHDLYDQDEDDNPRPVAIKSFRTEALDRDLTKVFAEARTLKALAHPSIIGIIDQGFGDPDTQARPYLILEYFAGQTLDQLGTLPLSDFIPIARRVAEAVHAAHTRPRPIYHRDLKPSNIMVFRNADGTWTVKVIDFGLAVRATVARAGRSVPQASRSTCDKSVTGTIKYAPPEQLGELAGVEIGAYSDVYTFGKTCLDTLFRTTAPKSWDWMKLPTEFRGQLQEMLERCTADALEHRYANFEPVIAALKSLDPSEIANRADEATEQRKVVEAERREAERQQREEAAERERAARVRIAAETAAKANRDRLEREAAMQKAREGAERQEALRGQRKQEEADHKQRAEAKRKVEQEVKAEGEVKAEDPPGATRVRSAGEQVTLKLPGGVPMTFAWCPPGQFRMGDWSENENERPVHTVTLTKGFFMGIHPVTQAQWKVVMGTDPSHFNGPNRPVESVTWNECQEFCTKLSALLKGSAAIRLPTEAEWEYACRAGTTTHYHFGDVPSVDLANMHTWGKYRKTTSVGSYPANAWGLYDLHGNVWEWCADGYKAYSAVVQQDNAEELSENTRVLRGGSWDSGPLSCRAAYRGRYAPERRSDDYGFRVCFGWDQEQQVASSIPVAHEQKQQITVPGQLSSRTGGSKENWEQVEREAALQQAREETERLVTYRAQRDQVEANQKRQAEASRGVEVDRKAKAADVFSSTRVRSAGETVAFKLPGNVRITFAWCPPGQFRMGGGVHGDETPVHTVTLTQGFFMGIHPITQAQWQAVMGTDPSHFKGSDRPVESVTWNECKEFCEKLTDRLKRWATVRMPTEAEWEYACRAGTTSDYCSGNDEAALKRVGWYGGTSGSSKDGTQPVGTLEKNLWGLYDVHGNVWEWCLDSKRQYTVQDEVDPQGKSNENSRVMRGGSWSYGPDYCRAANRGWDSPAYRHSGLGFRVCFQCEQ